MAGSVVMSFVCFVCFPESLWSLLRYPCSSVLCPLCVLTQLAMFQFVSSTMTHQKKAAVRFELEKALPSGE